MAQRVRGWFRLSGGCSSCVRGGGGKRWEGGCKGAKGQTLVGGRGGVREANRIFLLFELRSRKGVGCTLYTHFAKFPHYSSDKGGSYYKPPTQP